MRFWLCVFGLVSIVPLWGQEPSPIRRVVIYKDGHCLTEREVVVDAGTNPLQIENVFNALLGGVWATPRHKTAQLSGLYARWLEEKQQVAPASLAELLLLNEGKRVAVTVIYPAAPNQPVQTERYEGVLRVFKPNLLFTDAFPNLEPPPDYTPLPNAQTSEYRDRWGYPDRGGYYFAQLPDYAQDRFSRTAMQATFAVETDNRFAVFNPQQIKQIEFLEPPRREREATIKRPILELVLTGVAGGERVPIRLIGIEKGIRWIPEYQLILPSARASEATLRLGGVIRNELENLQEVEASIAIGTIQFMMQDQPSPLNQRDTFRTLSRWFGDQTPPRSWWYAPPPRISDIVAGGGFGGAPSIASSPGMGFEQRTLSPESTDSVAFLKLPQRLTLPKNSTIRVEIAQQTLPVEHTYLWIHDLSEAERRTYYPYDSRRLTFLTIEDIAYQVAQERRFRREVYEALVLRNTSNTPWTTAPISILRGDALIGQDILLFTPPGEEAFLFITPAPRVSLSCTVQEERVPSGWETPRQDIQRVELRATNRHEQPVRLMVRLRFIGHYRDSTREPVRVIAKSVDDAQFWDWYYRNRLQMNPYTEVVWDVQIPQGASEWQMRFVRKSSY